MGRILIFLVVLGGTIQSAAPLTATANQNSPFGSARLNQGSNIFSNFFNGNTNPAGGGQSLFGGQSLNGNIGNNLDVLKRNLQGLLGNMTLPGGQNVRMTFTNLFTLITNFLKGKGGSFQNLFKKGNLQDMIRNVTGVQNFNLSQQLGNGLLNGIQIGQIPGNSQGTKIGTTNLMSVLLSSLANSSGSKAGIGQGSNNSQRQQGGLLGGFAGTNTGSGFFNRG